MDVCNSDLGFIDCNLSGLCVCNGQAVIPGVSGGKILTGEPLTTDISRRESEGLLMSEVDKRITKIRPMSTPIDQLSRWTGARRSGSMIVDYYSVDVKPTKATLNVAYTEPTSSSVTGCFSEGQVEYDE